MEQRWPTLNEDEMPELPWYTIEENIQSLRKIEKLAWMYHIRPTYPTRRGPGDTLPP